MNTQRPEWNDANNALVGNGVSMVTLYYLYRYLSFMEELLEEAPKSLAISREVEELFRGLTEVFKKKEEETTAEAKTDQERYRMMETLGKIGENYRATLYKKGFSGEKKDLSRRDMIKFVRLAKERLQDTIEKNRREDGLYHSYNLLRFKDGACEISHLQEMLEGQVAVLSSKALDCKEAIGLLEALKESDLYREDQNSYMLYPERELPRFLEKNRIPKEAIMESSILRAEVEKGRSRFVEESLQGGYHFNGKYRNAADVVEDILLTGEYSKAQAQEVGDLFTEVFNHHAFTGRSGTFYKYEGLGCIYWHMVSKLVLAVEECYVKSYEKNPYSQEVKKLRAYYHEFKDGIGVDKSPGVYGAFPTDAYSHTPGFAGAQQPGMTGQVKEDILSRFGELGVTVVEGEIHFNPTLISKEEFLTRDTTWNLPDRKITLRKGQIGFTLCTVPVIYEASNFEEITLCYKNGDRYTFEDAVKINGEISKGIFNREGDIEQIIVKVVIE